MNNKVIKKSIEIKNFTVMFNKKFVYISNYFTIHKAAHKSNPRTHSPQQNKKAVFATAA